jgi:hypothetical protein
LLLAIFVFARRRFRRASSTQQTEPKSEISAGHTHHGMEAGAEVVGRDEDVVGPRGAVPVRHPGSDEVDGIGEQTSGVRQRGEAVGRGEVAGDVDGDEEEVGVLGARCAAGVGQQRLVHRHLGREEVARAPCVGGRPVAVEAGGEVVDVDPDAGCHGGCVGGGGGEGAGAGLGAEEGGGAAERRGGRRRGGEEEGKGEGEPEQEEKQGEQARCGRAACSWAGRRWRGAVGLQPAPGRWAGGRGRPDGRWRGAVWPPVPRCIRARAPWRLLLLRLGAGGGAVVGLVRMGLFLSLLPAPLVVGPRPGLQPRQPRSQIRP